MALSENQSRGIVYQYFLAEGWLPAGTTNATWDQVLIGDLGLDDPPLPSDPDFQKYRVSLDIQKFFKVLGSKVSSPKEFLKENEKTLGDLATWLTNNQG